MLSQSWSCMHSLQAFKARTLETQYPRRLGLDHSTEWTRNVQSNELNYCNTLLAVLPDLALSLLNREQVKQCNAPIIVVSMIS